MTPSTPAPPPQKKNKAKNGKTEKERKRFLVLFLNLDTVLYRVFSHDVTAAMLVSQTSPLGVELFSYGNAFFCSNKFAYMLAT